MHIFILQVFFAFFSSTFIFLGLQSSFVQQIVLPKDMTTV